MTHCAASFSLAAPFGKMSDTTFSSDENLPPLPLPSLENSLALYLESVKPLVDSEAFEKTSKTVSNFTENEKDLYKYLESRSNEKKNWVSHSNLPVN